MRYHRLLLGGVESLHRDVASFYPRLYQFSHPIPEEYIFKSTPKCPVETSGALSFFRLLLAGCCFSLISCPCGSSMVDSSHVSGHTELMTCFEHFSLWAVASLVFAILLSLPGVFLTSVSLFLHSVLLYSISFLLSVSATVFYFPGWCVQLPPWGKKKMYRALKICENSKWLQLNKRWGRCRSSIFTQRERRIYFSSRGYCT